MRDGLYLGFPRLEFARTDVVTRDRSLVEVHEETERDCGELLEVVRRYVLEASFLITLLRPHHRNFGKRLTKSPKIYFLDPGLLCSLLGIRNADDLRVHASRGAVFESFVLAELVKAYAHRGRRPPVYFWRD